MFHRAKKLVVVAEAAIKKEILDLALREGAQGYTVQDAYGYGRRGVRRGNHIPLGGNGSKNVRIEILAGEQTARRIAEALTQQVFPNYAGILYLADVETVREFV